MLYDEIQDTLSDLAHLFKEREARVLYEHYIESGMYLPGTRVRHEKRKGSLEVANVVSTPVRYDKDLQPTHVLCWVPETDVVRWFNLKTGEFSMTDVDGIPSHLHKFDESYIKAKMMTEARQQKEYWRKQQK